MPDEGDAVLTLPVDVDHRVVASLYEQAATLLGPGVHRLVIDLTATNFIDSTGIGLLVRIKGLADVDGCEVVLRNPSTRVRRTLELAGLAGYLPTETP